jgi:Domain of unknown function (DUF4351)
MPPTKTYGLVYHPLLGGVPERRGGFGCRHHSQSLSLRTKTLTSRALELLASWRITIETSELIDTEAQELIVQLSPAYTKWREETLQEGRQEGEAQLVIRLLSRLMGELSPELRSQIQSLSLPQLESLGEALLDFSQPSDLQDWLRSQPSP